MSNTPWYKEGLSFSCTGCGKCCTGTPGAVWISEQEIVELTSFLQIPKEEVIHKYTRLLGNRRALLEKPPKNKEYDCIFLEGKQCTIYSIRPKQCKTFPWWKENLESKASWLEAGESCEGINHKDAPKVSLEEIQKQLH